MILMWSCPGNMPKYYPGLRDILPSLDNTTLLYKYKRPSMSMCALCIYFVYFYDLFIYCWSYKHGVVL